jgi:hypothetical protein
MPGPWGTTTLQRLFPTERRLRRRAIDSAKVRSPALRQTPNLHQDIIPEPASVQGQGLVPALAQAQARLRPPTST